MVSYAPAIGYGTAIDYGTGSIRYSSTTSSNVIPVYGIDYATGDSVTNCYLRVKYTRGIDDGWAVVGENNGTCGIPWITTGASTTATTIKFHTWGEPHVEVEAEWRGIYNPQSGWVQYEPKPKTMAERIKEIIAHRNAPAFITDRKALDRPSDIREVRARETLCRVIGEEKFRRFLVQGHVTARAKSGLVYQIFPGHGITSVYDKGKKIERLCVVLRGDFPPTDSLIMRYLMILNNEENFRSYAIKHSVPQSLWPEDLVPAELLKNTRPKTLAEIYADIKSGNARIGEVAAGIRVAA